MLNNSFFEMSIPRFFISPVVLIVPEIILIIVVVMVLVIGDSNTERDTMQRKMFSRIIFESSPDVLLLVHVLLCEQSLGELFHNEVILVRQLVGPVWNSNWVRLPC